MPDRDRPGSWTLILDGNPMSHVDTLDPARLEFEYMRRFASVIDAAAPPRTPVDVLHLGGGALTLPRYVAATRPGSRQTVVEHDAALVALVRRHLPPPRNIRIRLTDAARFLSKPFDGYRVTLIDIPQGVPLDLAIRTAPTIAANIVDGSARSQARLLRKIGRQVCLMGESTVLNGRRAGNVVLVAAAALPVDALCRAAARDRLPVRVLHGSVLDRFLGVGSTFA